MGNLNQLIEEGKLLDQKRLERIKNSKYSAYLARVKIMSGKDFDEWAAKAVNYLEKNNLKPPVVIDVLESYKLLQPETSYDFYEKVMSVLSAKVISKAQSE